MALPWQDIGLDRITNCGTSGPYAHEKGHVFMQNWFLAGLMGLPTSWDYGPDSVGIAGPAPGLDF